MSALAASMSAAFVAAAVLAAVGQSGGRPRLRTLARLLAIAASLALLVVVTRPAARPFIAFALVAALAPPQSLPLALAAGSAALAGLAPATGLGSVSSILAAVACALAAHALGRSWSARLAGGADAARPAATAGAAASGLVLAVDGGGALRWSYGLDSGLGRVGAPDAGLVLGLSLLAGLAGALMLAADSLADPAEPSVSPLARTLGRRALLLGAGLALIAAVLIVRAADWGRLMLVTGARDVAALAVVVGLLACAVPSLLAERTHGDPLDDEQSAVVIGRMAVVAAIAGVLAAGIEGWLRAGTYATPATERLVAASLVGLGASEAPRGLQPLARALAVVALIVALVA